MPGSDVVAGSEAHGSCQPDTIQQSAVLAAQIPDVPLLTISFKSKVLP
jgi:hypothetical protein